MHEVNDETRKYVLNAYSLFYLVTIQFNLFFMATYQKFSHKNSKVVKVKSFLHFHFCFLSSCSRRCISQCWKHNNTCLLFLDHRKRINYEKQWQYDNSHVNNVLCSFEHTKWHALAFGLVHPFTLVRRISNIQLKMWMLLGESDWIKFAFFFTIEKWVHINLWISVRSFTTKYKKWILNFTLQANEQ